MNLDKAFLKKIIGVSHCAGEAILDVYSQNFTVDIKADESPITKADIAAHNLIIKALTDIAPEIPILSEESDELLRSKAWREWSTYWLIDPLDGTKEFVNRNGEFTVNIALIHEHRPVLGVVYVPVTHITYAGAQELGAYKFLDKEIAFETLSQIRSQDQALKPYKILASRSHASAHLNNYLEKIGEHQTIQMGSSIKFCLLAEGLADCYPRFGPTSEWDTAAGHAILEAAGGAVEKTDGSPLLYNTSDNILNPFFIAHANSGVNWLRFL